MVAGLPDEPVHVASQAGSGAALAFRGSAFRATSSLATILPKQAKSTHLPDSYTKRGDWFQIIDYPSLGRLRAAQAWFA